MSSTRFDVCESDLTHPNRTTSHDNVKMTLKWIENDWKMTCNDHFGMIFTSFWYHNDLLFYLDKDLSVPDLDPEPDRRRNETCAVWPAITIFFSVDDPKWECEWKSASQIFFAVSLHFAGCIPLAAVATAIRYYCAWTCVSTCISARKYM